EIIHGSLPNPIVITFVFENEVCVSYCMKRLNKINKNNVVLENTYHTRWFNENMDNEVVKHFIQDIELSNLGFGTFFDFYNDINMAVKAFHDSEIIGTYRVLKDDEARQQQEVFIKQIQDIEQDIGKIKAAIKKETQFNKKVELNMKVQQLKKELENTRSN